MFDAVSTVIPGASNANQVISNIRAGEMLPLTKEQMDGVRCIYNEYIKESVHDLW